MKDTKAVFVALVALSLGAQATSIDETQAKAAAATWVGGGSALGAQLGRTAVSATKYADKGANYAFYAVKMDGGGTVFMSADTEQTPVVAFTANKNMQVKPGASEAEGGAWAEILAHDAVIRQNIAKLAKSSDKATSLAISKSISANQRLWAKLLGTRPEGANMTLDEADDNYEPAKPQDVIDDVRVAPLMETHWSQASAGGGYCYNYYTPNHYVDGCVQTAAAQMMRYFKWPTNSVQQYTGSCTIGGKPNGEHAAPGVTIKLTTIGGYYDWDNMPTMAENKIISEKCRAEIGHICYDLGVIDGAQYTAGETGANYNTGAYQSIMGYSQMKNVGGGSPAEDGKSATGLYTHEARKHVFYANFDAGRPVLMTVGGYELEDGEIKNPNDHKAHAVVGDGYGFKTIDGEEVPFVHVNVGWGLSGDDVWYNIPDVNAANTGATIHSSGTDYNELGSCVCNISTDTTGDFITGRVTDDYGTPVSNATVIVWNEAETLCETNYTDGHGIYAFQLPAGKTYSVKGWSGNLTNEIDDIELKTGDQYAINSWGNDIILMNEAVKVGEENFASLDLALNEALSNGLDEVRIYSPTRMQANVAVTSDVSIVYAVATGFGSVDRPKDVVLSVENGARLSLKDVTFVNASAAPVLVEDGTLALAGMIAADEVLNVSLETTGTLELAGAISGAVCVSSDGAMAEGDVFGFASCELDVAEANAAKMFNAEDSTLVGKAVENGGKIQLVWAKGTIDSDAAIAYTVVDATTNYFNAVDDALALVAQTNVSKIVLKKSGVMNTTLNVSGQLTLVGENQAALWPSADARILVSGELNLKNVKIADYEGSDALIQVKGGKLVLEAGTLLTNLTCNATSVAYGPLLVDGGTLVMDSGARITGCVATAPANNENGGYGAGVYLKGTGATFDMNGGSIDNCSAKKCGGGVYAYKNVTVNLKGDAAVYDNKAVVDGADIYLASANAHLVLAGLITSEPSSIGVTYSSSNAQLNKDGGNFIQVAEGVSDDDRDTSLPAFFSNDAPTCMATVKDSMVVWELPPVVEGPQAVDIKKSPDLAIARLIVGDTTNYWASVEDVFTVAATNGASAQVIELLKDATFEENLVVSGAVTLRGAEGMTPTLKRTVSQKGIKITAGNKLTVENLCIIGSEVDIDAQNSKVSGTYGRLFDVSGEGANLILGNGAIVTKVYGTEAEYSAGAASNARGDAAVAVYNHAGFTMESGATITACANTYNDEASGAAAGVVADGGATVILKDAVISDCAAKRAGGLVAFNGSKVYVSGNMDMTSNVTGDMSTVQSTNFVGTVANMYLSEDSTLILEQTMTGGVGDVLNTTLADPNVFAEVGTAFSGSLVDLANSAQCFQRGPDYAYGVAVTNGTTKLLVWSTALSSKDTYTRLEGGESVTYGKVEATVQVPKFAFTSVSSNEQQSQWDLVIDPVVPGATYSLEYSDDLVNWLRVPNSSQTATVEGSMTFNVSESIPTRYWKVVAE